MKIELGMTMLRSIFYCVHIDYNRCMKQKSGDVMDNIRIHYSKNEWREEWWKMLSINMQSSTMNAIFFLPFRQKPLSRAA